MDNSKMDLVERGWIDLDWIHLAQDGESSCKCDNEPSGSINAGELSSGYTTGGRLTSDQLHRRT
jgi:hypothetical protein